MKAMTLFVVPRSIPTTYRALTFYP
jgi:hypothetical protein